MEYTADNPLELCDGQWHKITAWKDATVVKLQVDEGTILEGGGTGSQTHANIYDPLFVGGLPGEIYVQFTCCFRLTESRCLDNLYQLHS